MPFTLLRVLCGSAPGVAGTDTVGGGEGRFLCSRGEAGAGAGEMGTEEERCGRGAPNMLGLRWRFARGLAAVIGFVVVVIVVGLPSVVVVVTLGVGDPGDVGEGRFRGAGEGDAGTGVGDLVFLTLTCSFPDDPSFVFVFATLFGVASTALLVPEATRIFFAPLLLIFSSSSLEG